MDGRSQRLQEFQQGSGIKTIPDSVVRKVNNPFEQKKWPTFRKKGMATTSRPLGSTRSSAFGVGCGAVLVVYTAQKIDIEKGIFSRDMFRCYPTHQLSCINLKFVYMSPLQTPLKGLLWSQLEPQLESMKAKTLKWRSDKQSNKQLNGSPGQSNIAFVHLWKSLLYWATTRFSHHH